MELLSKAQPEPAFEPFDEKDASGEVSAWEIQHKTC